MSLIAEPFPELRACQARAIEGLRQGHIDDHLAQCLMLPTGGGKTVTAFDLIRRALAKGKRALFVADRTVLVNQASAVADRYGMSNHGVIQANHWRTRLDRPLQIASAQTLARRGWPEADLIIVDECFSPDVEILTENGFVRFDQLQRGTRVAQYDAGAIDFVVPTDYIDRPYCGEMVRLYSDLLIDLDMTPDHQMLVRKDGALKKVAASTVTLCYYNYFPVAGRLSGMAPGVLSPRERLMIALQADGSIHNRSGAALNCLAFSFAKQRKIDRFIELMRDGGFRWRQEPSTRNRTRFFVYDIPNATKNIWEHFDLNDLGGADRARAIIEEMVQWDGHVANERVWYYSSVVERCVDFYQAVALLAGFKTVKRVQHDRRSENFSDVHRLFIQHQCDAIATQRVVRSRFHYDGRVYCVRVPAGNIVVRRGGKPVVVGNCHTMYKAVTDYISQTQAAVIGLSATPFSAGLGRVYTNLVNAGTMHELTEDGILVPMRVFRGISADMRGAETAGGEWTDKAAEERGLQIVGDVVAEWLKHGENRKTICFGSTIKHCEELCREFNEAGVSAAVYVSETSADECERLVTEFKKHDSVIRVLISVAKLAKGFDQPDVGCVILARPLRKSLSEVIQMVGRGLRSSPETGKVDCLVLDHAQNMSRFAEDFEDIYFNGLDKLDDGEKLDKKIRRDEDEKPVKSCPKCGFSPMFKRCRSCGFEIVTPALVEQVAGELQEVMIGKKKVADDRRHLWEQLVTHSRMHKAPEKQKAYALALFKEMTGVWPKWSWNFEATPTVQITANTASWIRSNNIRRAKAREKAVA